MVERVTKGGQGRSDESVERDAESFAWVCLIFVSGAFSYVLWSVVWAIWRAA